MVYKASATPVIENQPHEFKQTVTLPPKQQENAFVIQPTNPVEMTPENTALVDRIKSGTFSASDTADYNTMVGDSEGARKLAGIGQPAKIQPTEMPSNEVLNQNTTPTTIQPEKPIVQATKTAIQANKENLPIDTSVGIGREEEILKNLNEGYKNAPDLFTDEATFKTSYGYAQADETKKKMLDAFYQAKSAQQNNSDAIFQQLNANVPIYNPKTKTTPAFKTALARKNDLDLNSGLSVNEVADRLKDGSITLGSQAYNDIKLKNPTLVKNAEILNSVNTGAGNKKIDSNTAEANVSESIVKNTPKEELPNLQAALEKVPEVKNALDTSRATKTEIDTLQDSLENIEESVRAEAKGTGATESYIQNLILERQKLLARQINTLSRKYSNELSTLKYYTDIATEDYNTNKEEMKMQQAQYYEAQKLKEARTYTNEQEKEAILLKEGDINSTDPYIKGKAISNAVDTILTQYKDIPMTRSREQMISDITAMVNSGADLGTAISQNIIKPIQGKPEFIAQQKANASKGVSFQSLGGKVYKVQNGEFIDMGISTLEPKAPEKAKYQVVGKDKEGKDIYGWVDVETQTVTTVGFETPTPNGVDIASFSTVRKGSSNVQCGELVNDYWKKVTGSTAGIGNTLQDKYGAISNIGRSEVPQVGGIFVSNPANNSTGHTGIIQSVNEDGSVTVREANSANKTIGGPAVTKTYSPEQVKDMRFSVAPEIKKEAQPFENLSKTQKADAKDIGATMKKDPQYTSYRTLANQMSDIGKIKGRIEIGKATPQDQQQLITAFSKVLDPTSVVRESEFEITRKYGQAGYQAALQSVSQYWRGDGILTADAAKILAESLAQRYDSIETEYNSVLQTAKDKMELYLDRPLTDEQFETLAQAKFASGRGTEKTTTGPVNPNRQSAWDIYLQSNSQK